MNKKELLKSITVTGTNVGFGAKKHLATYDILTKVPGLINFVSMTFGIYALVIDELSNKVLSATILVIGIISLYLATYCTQKYNKIGVDLIQLYNSLRNLYYEAKSANDNELENIQTKFKEIESEYYSISISKQILFSDWYAHYKFYFDFQTDWIQEEQKFSFWKNKIPTSLILITLLTICCISWYLFKTYYLCYK